ncbi:17542_t:CDS:1, partial [Racocetra fulgida]
IEQENSDEIYEEIDEGICEDIVEEIEQFYLLDIDNTSAMELDLIDE